VEGTSFFFEVRIPRRKLPIIANLVEEQEERIAEKEHREVNMGAKAAVKSKIMSLFIKGKIFLTPMETILIIPRELEYLERLVKLARRRKDVEGHRNQIATIHSTLAIMRVNVNKAHCSKTLHLVMEIDQTLIEGLVDTKASMLVMATNVLKVFSIMHLVVGHETYKTTFRIVMEALGRITELPIKVGGIISQMIFLMVNTYNYDLLLGLDFLIKI
jgi:hypothetical protein